MNEFAKLFEVQRKGIDYQVLCTWSYDDDKDEYVLSIETVSDGTRIKIDSACKKREHQVALFDAFDKESAERFLENEMIAHVLDAEAYAASNPIVYFNGGE